MASLSRKGPSVTCSEVLKIIACRRAVEFVVECGFTDLVIEGDNQAVMTTLRLKKGFSTQLGHIF